MKVKGESEKAGLKLNIQEIKIMASGPILANRQGNNGNCDRLYIFLGSKITAHGDCSHEINRLLLLGRKAVTNLDSMLKSRDIILPTKVPIIKAMLLFFFFQFMYGCEIWTVKKTEDQRIDAFELWC